MNMSYVSPFDVRQVMQENAFEIFHRLDRKMKESEAGSMMHQGRHLYMAVNDRSGPSYTVVFDDDYKTLCPWADVVKSSRVWPGELTDAAVEIFESEKNNREQRRKKRKDRNRE